MHNGGVVLSQEKSFSEMVAENAAAAAAAPTDEQPVVVDQAAQEAAAAATQATEGEGGAEPQVQVAPVADPFISWLAERGYDVDGVDPQDMYLQVEAGLQELQRSQSEIDNLKRQLESRPSAPAPEVSPAAPAPAPETPAQKLARKLAPLPSPDQAYFDLVEKQDNRWVPRAGYGAEALKAAELVNAYQEEKNRRAEKLLEDPFALIGEDLEAMVEAKATSLLEQHLRKAQEEQEAARQRQAQEEAAKTHEQRREEFYQSNKDKIFVLDAGGNPRRILNSNSYSISASGEKYFAELNRLQQRFPGADEVALMEEALGNVARSQVQAPAPVVAPVVQAPAQPQRTPEQVRQEYVAQNRTSVAQVPSQGTPIATMEQRAAASRGPRRFRDMVYEDPANADNPALIAR